MSHKLSGREQAISVGGLAVWRRQDTPHLLLDVREAPELAICQVAGAMHIPMGEIPARLGDLPPEIPIVVMCHHGMRSQRVVQYLRHAGWENAVNLDGGIDAWAEQLDPAMPRY